MEILQKEGKVIKVNFWPPGSYKSNPGTLIVCRRRRASGQEKYNTSSIYTVNLNRALARLEPDFDRIASNLVKTA